MGVGQVGPLSFPSLSYIHLHLLTRLSPQEMPTSGGGSRWARTGSLSLTEELGSVGLSAVWRQGMSLLQMLAIQTRLKGPSSHPSPSALPWFSHAPGTVGVCNERGYGEMMAETLSLFSSFFRVCHGLSVLASLSLYLVSLSWIIAIVARTKRVILMPRV